MTIQKQQKQNDEQLSALIDAEQLDTETSQIVTHLLNDSEHKERYIRLQYIKNSFSHQPSIDVRSNVSLALETLPTHFVDEAVSLQTTSTEDLTQTSWFKILNGQKMMAGMSIAASVMFATFFSLQLINSAPNTIVHDSASNNIQNTIPSDSQKSDVFFEPSVTSPFATLPAFPVSYPITSISQWQDSDSRAKVHAVTYKQPLTND